MDKPKDIIQIRIKDVEILFRLKLEDNRKGVRSGSAVYFFDRFYRTDVSKFIKGEAESVLSIVKRSWRIMEGLGNQQAWNRHNHVFCT